MATAPTSTTAKKAARKPAGPRTFFMIYKGQLDGEPTITFDKMVAIDRLLAANEAGDTGFKMKKIEVPRGARRKAPEAA